MAFFASVFIIVPLFFTTLIEEFAPVEYFVDVQQLEVGDMQHGTWSQNISLTRKVRKDLFGQTFQELRLTREGDTSETFFFATQKNQVPILFEVQEDNNVSFVRDWSEQIDRINPVTGVTEQFPRVPQSVLESLEVGESYYWTWVFEFDTTKDRTDIVTKRSNSFTILPTTQVIEINITSPESVEITQ